MERHAWAPLERWEEEDGPHPRERRRRWRLVPPAITPLEMADLWAGLVGQFRGQGRSRFRQDVESFLDGESSATYTSFRRALGACLLELTEATDGDRREVLIPAFCSSDFPDAIEGVGLEAVRYDVDPDTLAVDMTSVQAHLNPETLAVVAVNVLGYGSPMVELAERSADMGVYLVEALGYALGTEYENQRLGTFGDCAVLNFQQGKPIPIGGGMVVSQNPSLEFSDEGRSAVRTNVGALAGYSILSRPRAYHAYSRTKDLMETVGGPTVRITTHPESKFDVDYTAPFATISNFQGSIGHRVFDRLDEHRRQRNQRAQFYAEELADCPGIRPIEAVDGLSKHQYVRFPLIAETESLRDQLRHTLRREGVQATMMYDWPAIDPAAYPGAARLQRGIVTLPTHPYVDDRDGRLIVDTVRDLLATEGYLDVGRDIYGDRRIRTGQKQDITSGSDR